MDEFIAAMFIKYALDHLQQGVAMKTHLSHGSNVVCVEVNDPNPAHSAPLAKFRVTVEEVS